MCNGTAYTLQMCFKNSALINRKGISHLSDKDYRAAVHSGDTSRVSAVKFISVKEIALLKTSNTDTLLLLQEVLLIHTLPLQLHGLCLLSAKHDWSFL